VGGPLEFAWPRSRCFPVFQARIFRKGDLSQTARAMFLFLLTATGLGLAARCDPAGKAKGECQVAQPWFRNTRSHGLW
jgi:hypothetical protein